MLTLSIVWRVPYHSFRALGRDSCPPPPPDTPIVVGRRDRKLHLYIVHRCKSFLHRSFALSLIGDIGGKWQQTIMVHHFPEVLESSLKYGDASTRNSSLGSSRIRNTAELMVQCQIPNRRKWIGPGNVIIHYVCNLKILNTFMRSWEKLSNHGRHLENRIPLLVQDYCPTRGRISYTYVYSVRTCCVSQFAKTESMRNIACWTGSELYRPIGNFRKPEEFWGSIFGAVDTYKQRMTTALLDV